MHTTMLDHILARRREISAAAFAAALAGLFVTMSACSSHDHGGSSSAAVTQSTDSGDEFVAAYPVFMHPRCMNCHPAGDRPLQGDDSHVHAQNVQRGEDGKGRFGMKCAACHQDTNLPGLHMPPGNPNWRLPEKRMPLVFEGRSAAQLAQQLKDPAQNGNRTLAQILEHVTSDKLVLASWDPGDGRNPPRMSHDEFARHMSAWIAAGAVVPK